MEFDLSIVIPVFNEEDNIIPLYEELSQVLSNFGRSYEILFVDDGSTDASFSRLEELHAKDPAIKIIKFRRNFGQSAAMKAGFEHAKGKIIVTMDADMQNDPNDIPVLYEKLLSEDYDVICGWRYIRNDSLSKKAFSKTANKLRRMLTDESIHDSGCTFRAYIRKSVADIELYGELHRYIPIILSWEGYRVGEMKINHRERAFGKTKYSWQRLVKGSLDLLVITFWQRYSTRPMHIFGPLGLVMAGVGFFIVMYLGLTRIILGRALSDRPLFIVGLFLLVLGIQFIALGIIADALLKVYHNQSGRKTYIIEKVVE